MTRTKAAVKRRQQRNRLEREAQKAQLRQSREAEQHQQTQDEEEEVLAEAPQQNAENPEEQAEREDDRALIIEPIIENAREAAEKEDQERTLAEQPITAQVNNAREQEEDGEEEGNEEGKGEGGEEEDGGNDDEGQLLLTDYEKQRERRLKENAAKLAALNLASLASSFGAPKRPQRQSSKKKSKKDDDYMPSSSSDSEDSDSDDNNEERAGPCSQQDVDGDYNEDQALQEAIALSLTATADKVIGTRSKVSQTRKGKREVSDKNGGAKRRRMGRQEQFTIDEIASIFSLIDERGNGNFSVAELERIARSHDFTWTKQEISDMIDIFDSNKDGQLDLSEFQCIFGRMNMLKMHVT